MRLHPPMLAVIDLDGVVYDFVGAMHRWMTANHPRTVLTEATSWKWYRDWDPPMTDAEFARTMREAAENGWLWGTGSPLGGVDTMVAWTQVLEPLRAQDVNFFVQVVSSRLVVGDDLDAAVWALTGAWLSTWGFHYDRLSLLHAKDSKVAAVEEMRTQLGIRKADVYAIDDNAEHALAYAGAGYDATLHPSTYTGVFSEVEARTFRDWCSWVYWQVSSYSDSNSS